MDFRLLSDLHLEFDRDYNLDPFRPPQLATDKDTVCLLAGDIDTKGRAAAFALSLAEQFRAVVLIGGNHDYWGASLVSLPGQLREQCRAACNVHFLENEVLRLDGVSILGTTLWTDYRNDPLVQFDAERLMRDFKRIRTGPRAVPWQRKIRAADLAQRHCTARAFLDTAIPAERAAGQSVLVMTHHLPSTAVLEPCHKGDALASAYASEVLNRYLGERLTWVFGHQHSSVNMQLAGARLLSNPRGYAGLELNPDFDPAFGFSLPAE